MENQETLETYIEGIKRRLLKQKSINGQPYNGQTYGTVSGSIFYSTSDTLKPGIFYFMGLNPGGIPDHRDNSQSIVENILPRSGRNEFYEKWYSNRERYTNLQTNIQSFLGSLKDILPHYNNIDTKKFVENICSSNICFVRSKSVDELRAKVEDCTAWSVQEYIVNAIVKPSIIIINGLAGYRFFKKKLSGMSDETPLQTGVRHCGKEICVYVSSFDDDKLLIGIPHLSRNYLANCTNRQKNEVWNTSGFPEMRTLCLQAISKRGESGCHWSFQEDLP
ncbi:MULTISPECIES: hypothetical protein [unclassified Desulfovibrio]|uniref:hypothetical protein n=1 Tax=unclassified Desulfovibrio TaxID=2593640 RepID=UPI0013EC6788|nr:MULTISPECIES: hypothetical protein [unclassified Desulfovibrio]